MGCLKDNLKGYYEAEAGSSKFEDSIEACSESFYALSVRNLDCAVNRAGIAGGILV